MKTCFISGHLDLTPEEFAEHYVPQLEAALKEGDNFIVGDARGADAMAQAWLAQRGQVPYVYHMKESPRNNVGRAPLVGGFETDEARDEAMTRVSQADIVWLREGRWPHSGTARNVHRRRELAIEAERDTRRVHPRWIVSETEVYPVYNVQSIDENTESWRSTVPIPQELIDRLTRASQEWHEAQAEIGAWVARQERDPV
jgi:hypothetical protein